MRSQAMDETFCIKRHARPGIRMRRGGTLCMTLHRLPALACFTPPPRFRLLPSPLPPLPPLPPFPEEPGRPCGVQRGLPPLRSPLLRGRVAPSPASHAMPPLLPTHCQLHLCTRWWSGGGGACTARGGWRREQRVPPGRSITCHWCKRQVAACEASAGWHPLTGGFMPDVPPPRMLRMLLDVTHMRT